MNYDNVGKKIMSLAKILGVIFLLSGIFAFIALLAYDFIAIAFGSLVGGVLLFISSWFLYGFGQMVDDINAMRNSGQFDWSKESNQPKSKNQYALCNITEEDLAKCIVDSGLAEHVKELTVDAKYYQWGDDHIEIDENYSIKTCGSFCDREIKKVFYVIAESDTADLYRDALVLCYNESEVK